MPLHVFDWQDDLGSRGLVQDALYLLRPDTYVAVADATGAPGRIARYFDRAEFRAA